MGYVDAVLDQTAFNNAFNASQAELNRDWNEYMSSTSHQREVNDLIAAGLNPVLSANSGSSWNSVGNAVADPSAAQAMANLAATQMNNEASIEMSRISAAAQVAAASSAASINAAATRYAAEQSAQAARDTAPISFSAGSPHIFNVSGQGPAYMAGDLANSAMYGFGAASANGGYNF